MTGRKRFVEADFDDGRALVDALFAQGPYGLGWQARRLAPGQRQPGQEEPEEVPGLRMNPFSDVAPKRVKGPDGKPVSDATVRLPLDEHDMALAQARLDELDPEDRLLWLLLATTGMRLSEAFRGPFRA